ncbi:GyrI-like domain-containing protein [Macrococcus equipercicus]|nr:effector binding domain-containing protein [Macrococcus equipercicus]
MAYEVRELAETRVIGEKRSYDSIEEAQEKIQQFWTDFKQSDQRARLTLEADEQFQGFFGIYFPTDNGVDYMIGVSSDRETSEWASHNIPAGKYIVFEAGRPVSREIQRVTNEAYEVIIPASQHDLRQAPEFEYYPFGNVTAADYTAEMWIPVE